MHKYVRITIFLPTPFPKRGIIFVFPCYLAWKTDEVENSCGLSSHGEFLGVLSSIFFIIRSMQRSQMRD